MWNVLASSGNALSRGIMSDASHDDLNNDHMPEEHEAPARGGANPSAVTR